MGNGMGIETVMRTEGDLSGDGDGVTNSKRTVDSDSDCLRYTVYRNCFRKLHFVDVHKQNNKCRGKKRIYCTASV